MNKYAIVTLINQQNPQIAAVGFSTTGLLRNLTSTLYDDKEKAVSYVENVVKKKFDEANATMVEKILKSGTKAQQDALVALRDKELPMQTLSYLIVPVESSGELSYPLLFNDSDLVTPKEAPEEALEEALEVAEPAEPAELEEALEVAEPKSS